MPVGPTGSLSDVLAGFAVWLVERGCGDDATLPGTPCVPKAGSGCELFGTGIVAQVFEAWLLGPFGDQAPDADDELQLAR